MAALWNCRTGDGEVYAPREHLSTGKLPRAWRGMRLVKVRNSNQIRGGRFSYKLIQSIEPIYNQPNRLALNWFYFVRLFGLNFIAWIESNINLIKLKFYEAQINELGLQNDLILNVNLYKFSLIQPNYISI